MAVPKTKRNEAGVPGSIRRSKTTLFFLLLVVIAGGLASRSLPVTLAEPLGTSLGDVLWALMVYLLWAVLVPSGATTKIAMLAFVFSCCVELSQLYQAPWINAIRDTFIGGLVLGATFWWPDFIAYLLGVAAGVLLDNRFVLKPLALHASAEGE